MITGIGNVYESLGKGDAQVAVSPMENSFQEPEPSSKVDFFVSHASEDKDDIARPLYLELTRRGYRVWFDEAELEVGDSLTRRIDEGLRLCRHGVVILSQAFFRKNWPEYELQGLVQKAMAGGKKVILPIWHRITAAEVRGYSLSLADLYAANSAWGIGRVVDELERGVGNEEA